MIINIKIEISREGDFYLVNGLKPLAISVFDKDLFTAIKEHIKALGLYFETAHELGKLEKVLKNLESDS